MKNKEVFVHLRSGTALSALSKKSDSYWLTPLRNANYQQTTIQETFA